ncbi:MAG: universal stress protein [Myxococcota bacterium]
MSEHAPKRILVPVELTELSQPVLEYGYFMAKTFEADLQVLHVWEPPRYIGYDVMVNAGDHTQKLIEAIEAEARVGLDALLEKAPPPEGVKVDAVLKSGFAANVIVETCEEGFELIVMGTHGRSGVRHLLVGSVAERTARFASVPVVIVPTKEVAD